MHLVSILTLMVAGAAGVWYGFVDDIKLAFLAGVVAWATASVAVFRGNFKPPEDLLTDARLDVRTGAYALVAVALLVFGAAAAWVGFVEDIKIGVLVALLAWGAATYLAFSGGFPEPTQDEGGSTTDTAATWGLATLIIGAMLLGAVGVWYGLVEDMEWGMIAGLALWAGATLTTFRGKIATS
jgi:hypothetical protein